MFLPRFVASQSLLWILTAIGLLLIPRQFTAFFGAVLSEGAVPVARLFGGELTALAIVSYFETARNWPSVPRMAWLAYASSNSIGFAVSLAAVLSGAFDARGWVLAATYFLYAAVFVITFIRNPGETS